MALATRLLVTLMNNKKTKNSLQYIIKYSFFHLTAAISITFTIVSIGLIDFTENKLFIPHLQHDFEQIIQIYSERSGPITNKHEDSTFYRVDDKNMNLLPEYLKNLDVGHHEVFHNKKAFHILVKEDSQYRYLIKINQSDFEVMEWIIIGLIIIAMLLSWAMAIIVGRHLSKKILDPIQLLSYKILALSKDSNNSQLSNDFADDEIGQLARFFDVYNQKISTFLTRERIFTSDVSHELRTPLMVISSTCELLLAQYNDDKSHQLVQSHQPVTDNKNYLQILKIQSACLEMKSIVSIFLALARNEDINARLNTAESILETQYQYYQPFAQEKGLLLSLKINAISVQQYSEEFLTIVVSNLLRNAIKYTIEGEIQLTLNEKEFSIQDTGPGIPEVIQNSVFEPFVGTQISNSSSIGLGLSIVKRICERKGWQVSLKKGEGIGTLISITF